jgi:hypothetical protein
LRDSEICSIDNLSLDSITETFDGVSEFLELGGRQQFGDILHLTFERGTSDVFRNWQSLYRPGNAIVTMYDPSSFDRRVIGAGGVLIGCHRPAGVVPAGRQCAVRYEAVLAVRYAAVKSTDTNSTTGIDVADASVQARVRGTGPVYTDYGPNPTSANFLSVRGGRDVYLDCSLRIADKHWYHLADIPNRIEFTFGIDTGFLPASELGPVSGSLPECSR